MPMNNPSEETLAQARRVIDALNERGARKQAIRLKVSSPDAPLPQTASKFGGCPRASLHRLMRRVSRWA